MNTEELQSKLTDLVGDKSIFKEIVVMMRAPGWNGMEWSAIAYKAKRGDIYFSAESLEVLLHEISLRKTMLIDSNETVWKTFGLLPAEPSDNQEKFLETPQPR